MRGKKVLFILSLTVLVLFLLVGVFADFLAPCDPNAVDMANGLAAPSTEHWLGTDHIGRDLLSRLIYGSRSSVFIAFFATGCTLLLGMTIGLVSGYLGGWIDQLIQAVVNIFQGIPSAAFVVAILGLLGPGMRSLLIAIVVGLCWMLLPQIYTSILGLQESFSENINNLSIWLQKQLADNEALEQMVVPVYEQVTDKLETWLYDTLVPNMSMVINILSTGLLGVVTVLKNSLIGLIVMVYFLNIKDTLSAQSKKIVYSLFPLKQANRIIEEVRFTHSVFGGFITGKLLDSLIIGVICFFCMRLLRMPYVLLVSVIIGVTNVIPFFGPFIGAIPSAFLILLVSPMKCLYFLLFVLVLQQFDGNILGPKILGESTGLPSFWVLFSILLFGGLLGFVGMVIAVPTFAVFYHLTSEYVNRCLEKKALSQSTDDYRDLDYIDEAGNEYIERKE